MIKNNIIMFFFVYILIIFTSFRSTFSQPCSNSCNGHGLCSNPSHQQCDCFDGYIGGDCSEMLCPFGPAWVDLAIGVDHAHNPAECSNMGICNRQIGECACKIGFEGKACERLSCPNACTGQGRCQSMKYYATTKDPGTGTVYKYETPWDADMIYGCNCDTNFYGPDCSLRRCPTGDDPLTGTGTSTKLNPNQFNEIQKITCKAGGGSFTLTFRGKTTGKIPYNANANTIQTFLQAIPTIHGVTITMYSPQACSPTGASWTVEFTQDFGNVPLLVADSSGLFFSGSSPQVSFTVAVQTLGTKENLECSNRGICDPSTGYCTCCTDYDTSNGYNLAGTRGDCGFATTTIQGCPGSIACSAHGECFSDPIYKCACSDGWTGADCSERVCPKGTSWFTYPNLNNVAHVAEYNECSDMGVCDRTTGVCECVAGFTGAACNRVQCPGDVEDCNGHGQCVDMTTLATLATVDGGNLAGNTYGLVPNNPLTWDGARMFGCFCDALWTGFDCSLRVCPFGDDPMTRNQYDAQQLITCAANATDGYAVFSFRQGSTAQLPYSATRAQIQAAFQAVPSIGLVAVDLNQNNVLDRMCTPHGSQMLITFLSTHGPLPLLTVTYQNIDSISITNYKTGDKENLECSGRGICDRALGVCECFSGFGSSDGMGGSGTMGDCGYVLPIVN